MDVSNEAASPPDTNPSPESPPKEKADAEAEQTVHQEDPAAVTNAPYVKEAANQTLLAQLVEMGFPELRSEKALYYTKNAGLEYATAWLGDHEEDAKIDEPIRGPKLTEEEAEKKALELQRQIRETRRKKEKEDELERERRRIESAKQLLEMQRLREDAERKRHIEEIAREKAAHQKERERQKQLLKEDWERRHGKPYPEEEEKKAQSDTTSKSPKDQVTYWVGRLKQRRTDDNLEALRTCLKTTRLYCVNVQENPTNPKYQRLKKDNNAFKTRVAPFTEAVELLKSVGFVEDASGECLEISELPNLYLLGQAVKFLDFVINQLN